MYSDGVITTEFTGYYDANYYDVGEGAYVYPSGAQDLVVKFPTFYLSAEDGDFTSDGALFTTMTGESEDITIGNAPAKVFSATILNPDDLMGTLKWEDGEVSLGVVTSTSDYSVPDDTMYYCVNGGCTVRVTASAAYKTYGGTTRSVSLSSAPGGLLLSGATVSVYTEDGNLYYCNYNAASWSVTAVPPKNFLANKYLTMDCAIVKLGLSIPTERWTVSGTTATQSVYSYVPMGIYDFSTVDAFGKTLQVEAYDRMTLFDADATDWVQNLDFSNPMTISDIISELMTEMGMTATISLSAVNTSVAWSTNPITSYSISYRQVLKWLAEVIGCNVRIGRTGDVEFVAFDSANTVATITPDTIISNTRTKTNNSVPQITQAVCYNTLGAAYTSGTTTGTNYYFVANPFLDPSADLTPLTNLKTLLGSIPAYYPTAIGIACYDPRIDAGDFLTLQMPDGKSPYSIPVMRQTMKWASTCTAEITASGNQVRQIPDSMANTDLSSVVDSNPSSVVNKIEAVGISADWITTGKLTVLDSNTDVLFEADKDTHQVQIGGFAVEDDRLIAQTTETVGGVNYTNQVKVKTDEIELSKLWNVTSSQLLNLSRSELYLYFNNSAITNRQTAHIGNGYLTLKDASTYLDVNAASVKLHTTDGTPITDPNDPDTTFENPIMELKAGMSGYKTTASADAIKTTDGTNTITASPTGLSFDDGTNPASMRMYTMVCASSSETTQTKTLPAGAYVIYHWRNRAPTQGSTGIQFAVIGESSYQSIIEIGGSGTHVTHDSTMTGTRSYCNVVSAGNGTGTLTWTASGLTNRMLTLVRLW